MVTKEEEGERVNLSRKHMVFWVTTTDAPETPPLSQYLDICFLHLTYYIAEVLCVYAQM